MKLYLNNLTTMNKQIDELNETTIIASGYDRMKYINPSKGEAGDLGFDTWIEAYNRPVIASETGSGSLDLAKWYSIVVVPVDTFAICAETIMLATPIGAV